VYKVWKMKEMPTEARSYISTSDLTMLCQLERNVDYIYYGIPLSESCQLPSMLETTVNAVET